MIVQKVEDGGVAVPVRVANGVVAIDGWMGLPWLGREEEELVVCCRDGGRRENGGVAREVWWSEELAFSDAEG